jgi:hypothetical protein
MEIKGYLGELFLIIGGFILAETIIKNFLDMADGKLPYNVLPMLALIIIAGGIILKNKDKIIWSTWVYWIGLIILVILIVLFQNGKITPSFMTWGGLIIGIVQIISFINSIFFKKQ